MKVISLSFYFNAVSALLKGGIGLLAGSHALVADALHSLTDTASFGINYYGVRNSTGSRPAISGKQTALIGALTLLTGVFLCGHNVSILIIGKTVRPGLLGIIVSLASIIIGWHLYQLSCCANERFNDINIFICKVQNRTNLVSAFLSLTGLALADLGFLFADPLAAVVIGCLMIGAAVEMFVAISGSEANMSPAVITGMKQFLIFAIAGIVFFFAVTTMKTIVSKHVVLIPSEGPAPYSMVDKLLGRARYFIIYNEKENRTFPVFNTDAMISGDVSHNLVSIIQRNGVDVVLAGTIGYEMYQDLKSLDVDIYYLNKRGPVGDAYLDFKNRRVKSALGPNVDRGFGRDGIGWMRPW